MPFELIDVREIGMEAYNLHFDPDGHLWFSTLAEHAVMRLAITTAGPQVLFNEDQFCSFHFDDGLGCIGTMDGRVLVFSADAPSLRVVVKSLAGPVGAINIDRKSQSLFCASRGIIYRFSLDGALLIKCRCSIPPGCIQFSERGNQLWSVSDGIEVFDLTTRQSFVKGQGRCCPYSCVAVAPNGNVACFGGDIDIFNPEGIRVDSLPGDYNRGCIDPTGRLIAHKVTQDIAPDVTISTTTAPGGTEFDEIASCDSHVLDSSGNSLVASHNGKLYCFSRR